MDSETFVPHISPGVSRLEAWREEIRQMRAANWPCAKTAQWLAEYKNCQVTEEAVRQFCQRRGIEKKAAVVTKPPQTRRRPVASKKATPRKFEYKNANSPIDLDS